MASSLAKILFRIVIAVLLLMVLFYIGRPLYWKISATVHDIRNNKQTVQQGISQIVLDARNLSDGFMMNPTLGSMNIVASKLSGDCFKRSCG